jgi:hypothetical protein
VPLVRGKPSALRLFPATNQAGWGGVPVDVSVRKAGSTVFSTRIVTGVLPTLPSPADPAQGIIIPLPPSLDIEGATLHATIDPDGTDAELDEWDNTWPVAGADPAVIVMVAIPTLRIRMVPIAPVGGIPPTVTDGDAQALAELMRTIYPTASVEVSVRPAGIISSFPWNNQADLSNVLGDLEVERVADGFSGHYYGVHDVGAVDGIVGLGTLSGLVSLGNTQQSVFAHEVGHNLGLGHTPGCGAGNPNNNYPYPNGQIGLRGYDARTQTVVPATAIDIMGYCGGTKWLGGGYFSGIFSVLRSRSPGTLRATPTDVVPVAIRATFDGDVVVRVGARRLDAAAALSEQGGEVAVTVVDADGRALATAQLPLRQVADAAGAAVVAGVVAVPSAVAERATAVWITARGRTVVAAVER